MKTFPLLLTLLLAAEVQAQVPGSTYDCASEDKKAFQLVTKQNPDNESQAVITQISAGLDFGGNSAWLTETKLGFNTDIYQYELGGGQLSISETTMITRGGGCGRGSCDGGGSFKSIHAKFVSNDKTQQINFNCH